ncbi:MAG: prolyl oligopeptidase family serine peptidase [bacterium]|nr:prolyl oligopeptidase family serine peptidase [bacterium]
MHIENYEELGIEEITVRSSIDGSEEPSLFWRCPEGNKVPLLVGLHTWSFDRHNQVETLYPVAKTNQWHLLLPEFRGPNLKTNPRVSQACASNLAMQDVIDAIDRVCSIADVDKDNIFLIGGSGGGHMALMLAGYKPDLWTSIASFCPVTDLIAWYYENKNYSVHVEACCGGPPCELTMNEYRKRSPIFNVEAIAKCKQIYIYHGKFDPSVPFTQSLNLFNKICQVNPKANVFLEIFDGGHMMILEKAENQFINARQTSSNISS